MTGKDFNYLGSLLRAMMLNENGIGRLITKATDKAIKKLAQSKTLKY
jgi:hypothetical protein